jgi:hypothetical protein
LPSPHGTTKNIFSTILPEEYRVCHRPTNKLLLICHCSFHFLPHSPADRRKQYRSLHQTISIAVDEIFVDGLAVLKRKFFNASKPNTAFSYSFIAPQIKRTSYF